MNASQKLAIGILFGTASAVATATNNTPPAPAPAPQNNVSQGQHQGQNQHQGQHQGQSQNAYGGQGGQGGNGYGGAGGNATGGNSASSSDSNANAQASATNGGLSNTNNFNAPKPMGNVAGAYLVNNSDCGEGFSLFLSAPYLGIGGGHMSQSQICLSQKAATALINAGVVKQDDGMVAVGIASLSEIHPEIKAALEVVYNNLTSDCVEKGKRLSVIVLARKGQPVRDENGQIVGYEGMDCIRINEAYRQFAEAAKPVVAVSPAPAAVPVPVPAPVIQFPDRIKVEIDGVVKTKEQYTPRKGPAPKKEPLQVEIVKMPCDCDKPAPALAPK